MSEQQLSREQMHLLDRCDDLGFLPEGAHVADVLILQLHDLLDDYGRLTSLGAMVLARWEDAHDEPYAHVGFEDVDERDPSGGAVLAIVVVVAVLAVLLIAVGAYGLLS